MHTACHTTIIVQDIYRGDDRISLYNSLVRIGVWLVRFTPGSNIAHLKIDYFRWIRRDIHSDHTPRISPWNTYLPGISRDNMIVTRNRVFGVMKNSVSIVMLNDTSRKFPDSTH